MPENKKIPLLIDFDGVIRIGDDTASYAKQFLEFIYLNKIPAFILSNSTLRTKLDINNWLKEKNLFYNIPAMTSVDATLSFVADRYKSVSVYCVKKIKYLFKDFINDKNPEAVVIGDIGNRWNFKLLNEIFHKVDKGAEIIAMHKNKYWLPNGKDKVLDAGTFISAIEYAANKKSILIGKPSPIYFQTALSMLGYNARTKFFMLGDDIEADINAAQNAGGKGILIYTGKTNFPLSKTFKHKPDYEAKNLKQVITLLEKIY